VVGSRSAQAYTQAKGDGELKLVTFTSLGVVHNRLSYLLVTKINILIHFLRNAKCYIVCIFLKNVLFDLII
jgi:hypothetical protein